MAEADPVRTLGQAGGVRVLKRLAPEPAPMKAEPGPSSAASPLSGPVASSSPWIPPPFPPFQPAATPLPLEAKKADPAPAPQAPASSPVSTGASTPEENDSPFILTPAASPTSAPRIILPAPPPLMPLSSIFHRKARMTELARIVLPPKREESQPLPASSPTVVPPAFPVAGAAHGSKPEISLSSVVPRIDPDGAKPPGSEATTPGPAPIPLAGEKPSAPLPDLPEAAKPVTQETAPTSTPVAENPPSEPLPDLPEAPKVDPEAHKPEPSATPLPKVDPEAHKAASTPAPPIPLAELSAPSGTPEKREFHLANGERVAGTVLSETPEAIYIDHGTLGVLTIPRAQIAKRLVEIILINGDRIVGDIMAETADTLYVRHASLGMLTVPRAQRSTRVVEAILKDGDRILGEVLTETDTFTVIRSATLGTVTVPHSKVSMLNRKIEQIELKALPPPSPELKDKPSL